MHCARYGRAEILKYLANMNVDINIQNKKGNSALHIATSKGNIEMVKVLLDLNINIDLQNKEEETAMDIAEKDDCEEMEELKELLSSKQVEQKKITILLNACKLGHVEKAKNMLADVKINGQNPDGDTALILATMSQNIKLCSLLLEEGANIDHQNGKGQTALHVGVLVKIKSWFQKYCNIIQNCCPI